jgi:hypothetical protein
VDATGEERVTIGFAESVNAPFGLAVISVHGEHGRDLDAMVVVVYRRHHNKRTKKLILYIPSVVFCIGDLEASMQYGVIRCMSIAGFRPTPTPTHTPAQKPRLGSSDSEVPARKLLLRLRSSDSCSDPYSDCVDHHTHDI